MDPGSSGSTRETRGGPPFILNDATKTGEGLGFDRKIMGVAHTMDFVLVSLQGALGPFQVWHDCAYGFFLMFFLLLTPFHPTVADGT